MRENISVDNLLSVIEAKRAELNKLIDLSYKKSLTLIDKDVIKKSEELDILLVKYTQTGMKMHIPV